MLLDELLPLLSGLGLRTAPGQVGVLGWSMGGAGALRLAGVAVKVDCGANDPFAPATRALAAALPDAEVAVTKGCHDGGFWQRQAPAQLRFLAAALGP